MKTAFLTTRALIVLLAGVNGCRGITGPNLPIGAVPLTPPRAYTLWWSLTEACSERTGDFSAIRWYVLPGKTEFEVDGKVYQSYWWSAGNVIVVAEPVKLIGRLVRHEMLHALTGGAHTHEHFVDKCGGVVVCGGDCLSEAGDFPSPPPSSPVIGSADLDVAVRVDPINPSLAVDSGWIAITVTATHPMNYPVWVQLDPVAPDESSAATFGYVLDCLGACAGASEYTYMTGERLGFNGGQTRQYVFDRQLPAEAFSVRGFFNTDTSARVTFRVVSEP